MSRNFLAVLLGIVLAVGIADPANAQVRRVDAPIYDAPGNYGMAYGHASYGVPRTYSQFNSPFGGVAYGFGLAPYSYLPGPFGADLWRPGFAVPGYAYGSSMYLGYRTYPAPLGPTAGVLGPPVGFYAPAFGPPGFLSY